MSPCSSLSSISRVRETREVKDLGGGGGGDCLMSLVFPLLQVHLRVFQECELDPRHLWDSAGPTLQGHLVPHHGSNLEPEWKQHTEGC